VERLTFTVEPDEARRLRLLLTAPAWMQIPERFELRIWVEDLVTRERSSYDTHFRGPEQ